MKKFNFLTVLLLIAGMGNLSAQTAKVGKDGAYVEEFSGDSAVVKALQYVIANENGIDGDTIFVAGEFTIPAEHRLNAGYADAYIYMKGEGMGQTIIQQNTDEDYANNTVANVSFFYAKGGGATIHISDITLKNSASAIMFLQGPDYHLHLKNVHISNSFAHGIQVVSFGSLHMDGCIVDGTNDNAIFPATTQNNWVSQVKINNCLIRDCKAGGGQPKNSGIQFWNRRADAFQDVEITNCVFYNNEASYGSSAIGFGMDSCNVKLINNTFANNIGAPAVYFEQSGNVAQIKNNLLYGTKTSTGGDTVDFSIRYHYDVNGADSVVYFEFAANQLIMQNNFIDSIRLEVLGEANPVNNIFNTEDPKLPAEIDEDGNIVPLEGSLVIDAGIEAPPYTDGYFGAAPDIGAYETNYEVVGVEKFENQGDLLLYPNPANSNLNIKAKSTIKSMTIMDMNGRIVHQRVVNNDNTILDIGDLAPGMYMVKASFITQAPVIQRIIKK